MSQAPVADKKFEHKLIIHISTPISETIQIHQYLGHIFTWVPQELLSYFLTRWGTIKGQHLPYRFLTRQEGIRDCLKSQHPSKNRWCLYLSPFQRDLISWLFPSSFYVHLIPLQKKKKQKKLFFLQWSQEAFYLNTELRKEPSKLFWPQFQSIKIHTPNSSVNPRTKQ